MCFFQLEQKPYGDTCGYIMVKYCAHPMDNILSFRPTPTFLLNIMFRGESFQLSSGHAVSG